MFTSLENPGLKYLNKLMKNLMVNQGLKSRLLITTQKCNIFLEKMMVGRRFFPFGMVAVQGPSSILGVYPPKTNMTMETQP